MNSKLFSAGGIASFLLLLALCTGLLAYGVTEEVPIGSVQGTAVMSESGKPLKGAVVVLRPTFDIPDWEGRARSVKSDAKGTFAFRNIPAGSYAVEAYTEAHTLAATNVSVVEGQTSNFDLSLQPTAPYLELYASQHVFSPSQKASLQARGFATESALTVSVYEVKFESIAKKRGLYQVLSPLTYENPQVDPDRSPDFTRVKQTTWPIKNRNDEGIFDEYVILEGLPEGIYWVRTQAGARQRGTWVMISKIALVTKSTLGATTSARAMATRCCCPPVSSAGVWWMRSPRPRSRRTAMARARRRAGWCETSGSSTCSSADMRGSRWKCWKTKPKSSPRRRVRMSSGARPRSWPSNR